MPRYQHFFSYGFSIYSDDPNAMDVSGADLRDAITESLDQLSDQEVYVYCDEPFETLDAEEA